jgi:hypothetical protein
MVRAKPAGQSAIVELGIPALIFGLGSTILGFTDFAFGIAVMGVSLLLFWWILYRRFNNKVWIVSIIVSISLFGVLLAIVYKPAPLSFLIELNSTTYTNGADINGIKWQPHFTEMDVVINNATDHDYSGLDVYVKIDALLSGGGISPGVNQCNIGPDLASVGPFTVKGIELPFRLFSGTRPILASIYRMRCDKFISRSKIDIVFAVVSSVPLDRTKTQPRWSALQIDYTAIFRPRHCFIKRCFMDDCGDMKTINDPPCDISLP